MPALRSKVATEMGTEVDQLKREDVKTAMLETFQEFLLNGPGKQESDDGVEDDGIDEEEEPILPVKKAKVSKPKPPADKKEKEPKVRNDSKPAEANKKTKADSSKPDKSSQIDRLKSYIFKCGIRKVW